MSESSSTRPINVVVAGATGWAGSALALGVIRSPDLNLVGALSRSLSGQRIGTVLGADDPGVEITGTIDEVLASQPDVFVEYTHPSVARQNILAALESGAHVVVGSSGLTDDDYAVIDKSAGAKGLGVLACGNFSITAILMMKFSEMAAHWVKNWEIIDYGSAGKVDAPSGTARELAGRLSNVGTPETVVPIGETRGEIKARGATLGVTQVHSVRLPGFVLSVESLFGADDERLSLRHDAGTSATPYVAGGLLAIRQVGTLVGLHRGLDTVMDLS